MKSSKDLFSAENENLKLKLNNIQENNDKGTFCLNLNEDIQKV